MGGYCHLVANLPHIISNLGNPWLSGPSPSADRDRNMGSSVAIFICGDTRAPKLQPTRQGL